MLSRTPEAGPPVPEAERYVQTADLRADLKGRSVRSGFIMLVAQPLKLALGIGTMAVLARLLDPEAFGLLAMVAALLALVDSLQNLGIESATVQRENVTHQQISTLFWLSLKVNAVVLGLMVLMGPVLAWFYGRPELVGITAAMAVGVLALCLSMQHASLLKRQMRFGALTLIDLGSLAAGTGAAITAALLGAGYWALVLEVVVMQVTKGVAYWTVCGWRPARYTRAMASLDETGRAMFSYGAHLTGFRFVTRAGNHLDRILIGYVSGASALGLYDVARRWAHFPFKKVYQPIFDVAVSSFSRTQHNPDLYRAYVRRGLLPIFALSMPALAFSFAEAETIILLLLGNQWTEAIPLFQLLAIAVFAGSMQRVTKWLFMAEGTTRRQLWWGLISTPIMIGAVAVGALYGAYGVALSVAVATCVLTPLAIAYCLKTSPLSWRDFLSATWRPGVASLAAALLLVAARPAVPLPENLILNLVVKLVSYGVLYVLVWVILPGGWRAGMGLLQMAQALRSSTKGMSGADAGPPPSHG